MAFLGKPLLSARFWFNAEPLPLPMETVQVFAGILAGLFIAGLLARAFLPRNGRTAQRIRAFVIPCVWMAPLGFVLLFFSYERVYLFGAPLWYLGWVTTFLAWLLAIAWRVFVEAPRKERQKRESERITKYLPKQKA